MDYLVANRNELYHFKYIKREPDGNGGWRYFYNTGRQRNVSGQGRPIYKRDVAPVARPVSGQNMSARPRRNAAGNTYTQVSGKNKYPTLDKNQYYGWNVKFSPSQYNEMYKNASSAKDHLNRLSKYRELSDTEKADLQWESSRANVEGRNMAAANQELDRQRKAAEAKKPINVAKATVKSISTSVGSAFDKGKNWLSNLFKK